MERRMGIEGWSAQPGNVHLADPETVAPLRWKQMTGIFRPFFTQPAGQLLHF